MKSEIETSQNRNDHLEMMARMISHNLRSPMAGMKMLFSLYEMSQKPEDKEDIYQNLKGGAQELFGMVEDLAKVLIDYAQLKTSPEELIFDEVYTETLDLLEDTIKEKKAIIKADFEDSPSLNYFPVFLESIFKEILENALRYSSEDRTLELSIRSYIESDYVMLEFKDNGIGIDLEKHQGQLFKMYKTFHNNPNIPNKGIGLFTIKNQVEILGGKISLQSTPNEGTSITIKLAVS